MKNGFLILVFLYTSLMFSQNIQVNSNTYTPQELIENILINSDCISNVVVTNVVGGNFGSTDQSYGYFDASGTSFPIQNGIVLSTGRLSNVPGPNTSLSDDDASAWSGDNDLETVLGESNTYNATIIEFEFESIAEQVSFRYLFASEEYQEGSSSTCNYSDLFGFLIRPAGSATYNNIALVPGTSTPVKVTTVHSGVPGSCDPINETYFGSWNDTTAPINFNGQTTVLTANATIIPNLTYQVKLVIADEQNYRYDSAVFLEAGSFLPNSNLGLDRLFATNNPLCENETLNLDATQTGAISYTWFKDGIPIPGETNPIYTVINEGVYSVEINYPTTCIASGEITLEYSQNPMVNDFTLSECDLNQDGITIYNLFDAELDILTSGTDYISNFYALPTDAQLAINPITNISSFENTSPMQNIFARVENEYGCFSIAQLTLDISSNTLSIPNFFACDNDPIDGYTVFDLIQLRTEIELLAPTGASISFFSTEEDLFAGTNVLNGDYTNTNQNTETIFVLINDGTSCYAISTVDLTVNFTPELLEDETIFYCTNSYPNTSTINAGILTGVPEDYTYEWLLNGTTISFSNASININETGIYTVIVTHPNGCTATRNITVEASNIAAIDTTTVIGVAPNNSITFIASGNGNYEYVLDNINGTYQDSNIFTNVSAGIHTIYVRDKNGCGITEEEVYVLGFPSFFTPNGDNYHDTWMPLGVDLDFQATMSIQIFDRYGKLLQQVNPEGLGWNGRFNGKDLTVDDYWYIVTFSNGETHQGHFALKR